MSNIVVPAVSENEVARGLRWLTEQIARRNPELLSGGLLGGEFGYGADYSNSVFMMKPYCWCERDDCDWCAGCTCPDETSHYLVDGVEVDYDRYSSFFDDLTGPYDAPGVDFAAWEAKADEANARRSMRHDPVCDVCTGVRQVQPNFRHHATGTTVSWYKYLGRGMCVDVKADWNTVLDDCLASLPVL